MATAERLGYRGPSAVGRMLRTGRVGTIGLVFTDDLRFVFADPNTTSFMRGVAEATAAANSGLTLLPIPQDPAPAELALLHTPVDGHILFSVADAHPVYDDLLSRGTPLVVIDEPDPGDRCSFVGVDDRLGARLVAEHVAGLGHTAIGVIAHRLSDAPRCRPVSPVEVAGSTVRVVRERFAGYLDGLGGVAPVALWEAGGLTVDAGRQAAVELHRAHPEVTAILCMTDQLAIGACTELERLGVRVPDDVSIAGYDDIARAATWSPALTTLRQPLVDKGRIAAAMLQRQLDDRGAGVERVELPIELVIRRSTAPAPRR